MNLVYFLWSIVCLMGNAIQLYWISNRYFQYQVTTSVHIYSPEEIDIPTQILCFDSFRLLNVDNMTDLEKRKLLISDGFSNGRKGQMVFDKLSGYDFNDINRTIFMDAVSQPKRSELARLR